MGFENLEALDIYQGIFTLMFVLISIIVGLRILLKYFEHKRKELITVGIAWMGISTSWWGNSFSFLMYVLFNSKLNLFTYLFIENAFTPIALACWIYAFSYLVYPRIYKKVVLIFMIIYIPYEIFLISALIIKPEIIGVLEGKFDANYTIIPNLFRIVALITLFITGILFGKNLIRSDNKLIKWKGRFLLLGIITFIIAAILDVILTLNPVELVLVRVLLILSSFEYYLGFFLSERLANLFIKKSDL